MKKTTFAKIIALALPFVLFSCNNNSLENQKSSNTTGWKYNDKNSSGFEVQFGYQQVTPPGMVFIEGGTFSMGRTIEDVMGDWNNAQRRVTVSSFYMDQYEISNLNWREYIHWMRMVYGKAAPVLVDRALPDTLVWREELAYNEPYLQYYYGHVAYNYYPVVGVNWEQASDYCAWRTDRVNEMVLAEKGVIAYPDFQALRGGDDIVDISENQVFNTEKYIAKADYEPTVGKHPQTDLWGEQRKATMSDGDMFPAYRLPTEAEWEYAALSVLSEEGEENYVERRIYPWSGSQVRNPNKKYRGQIMANVVRGKGDLMGMGHALNDHATVTAPVNSYWPNDFGLYNMAGNVNEWVADVYRPASSEFVQEYNPYRGNEYKSSIYTETTIDGATVRTPKVDSLGRLAKEIPADRDNEVEKYGKLDVRNYQDGDYRSGLSRDKWKTALDPDAATKLLYDPDTDADGMLTTKISNTTRVYKGGSWKDRAYWLSPGTRRYLEQKECRNDIGFRCAMSKVGAQATQDK